MTNRTLTCRWLPTVFAIAVGLASPDSAAQTIVFPDGLVAHWRLDEPSGSRVAADSSGQGHDGAVNAGLPDPVFTTADKAPIPGNAGSMTFRGVDLVDAGDVPEFRFAPGRPMSLMVWVKQTQSQGVFHILGKRSGCSDDSFDYQIAGDPYLQVTATSVKRVDTGQALPLNEWIHIAVTYDGASTLRIYRNGVLAASSASFVLPEPSSARFRIGTSGDCPASQRFVGLIDDVRVYSRALTREEIATGVMGAEPGVALTPAVVSGPYGGSVTLRATLTLPTGSSGKVVAFTLSGAAIGTAVTDADGIAVLSNVSIAGIEPGEYPSAIQASFAGDESAPPSTATGKLVVRAAPIVTLSAPSSVVAPYTLAAEDLVATSSVPGTFSYTPAIGTTFSSPGNVTVTAHFVPTDSSHYLSVDASVTIFVDAPATIPVGWLDVSPQQLQFGDQPVTTTSAAQTITITNPGAPVTLGAILISGADASNFAATNGCFKTHLATGESCSISVSFAPVHGGRRVAQLLIGDQMNLAVLRGTATGTTPKYAVPRYDVTVAVPGDIPYGSVIVTGFNNRGEISGFVRHAANGSCPEYISAFVHSAGTFTELRNLPGSPLNVAGPCPISSVAVGVDDAGEVFGVVHPPGWNAVEDPYSFKYAGGVFSGVAAAPGDYVWGVTPEGIVLYAINWSYWFDGELVFLNPPDDLQNAYCTVFDAAARMWIDVRDLCLGGVKPILTLGGMSMGPIDEFAFTPPSLYRAGVFTDTGATDSSMPFVNSVGVNSSGQAIISTPVGWLYWDRRVGAHRLEELLPAGWTLEREPWSGLFTVHTINENGHIVAFAHDAANTRHLVILKPIASTPAGENVAVQSGSATLTFDTVTSAGTTTVEPIDAASAGTVPGGFAISDTMAYEITSTASFSGPVTLAFVVSGRWSETEFNDLRVLHNENGTLVDITTGHDYSRLIIFATTTSFSPFYIARRGVNIAPLFDPTRAYKAGSTVPIKLQVRNASNANLSSAAVTVTARTLVRIGDATDTTVIDAGNANADGGFRFDPALGGTGGYIFNLSTKTLTRGRYSLSLTVGGDKAFVYNVAFEIR